MEINFLTLSMVIAFLLLVSAISSIVFKKIKIPYTIGLVIVGIILSAIFSHFPKMETMHNLKLTTDLIMYMLLPVLIFDAAVNLDIKLFLKNISPALTLAGPGLIIATLITGVIMAWLSPLSMAGAILFGALISATDPVAVISLFELVGAPKRLSALVDGESLFNDATAIVMFNIVLGIITSGAAITLSTIFGGVLDFVMVFAGGFLVGAVIGFIFMSLIKFAKNDPLIVVGLSIVIAFCSFIVADRVFEFSGVMSSVGAGVMVSYFSSSRFNNNVSTYMKQFWSLMSFIANSVIFLLLGFTEELLLLGSSLAKLIVPILVAILAIQVARIVVVFGLCPLFGWKKPENKISWAYKMVMFWGGLRGAVPLALVFGLPADLENRELLIQITLGVVLFTLLVQGTTIQAMLSHYKLDCPEKFTLFSKKYTLIALRKIVLEKLKIRGDEYNLNRENTEQTVKKYEDLLAENISSIKGKNSENNDDCKKAFNRMVWNVALTNEQECYSTLYHSGFCSEVVFRNLLANINAQLEEVSWGYFDGENIENQPIEYRAKSTFFNILGKLNIANKMVSKYKNKVLVDDYFQLASLLFGSKKAIEGINSMVEFENFAEYENELNKCKHFYQQREQKVLEEFQTLHKQYAELNKHFDSNLLRQIISVSEINELYRLQSSGEASDEVVEMVIEMLEEHAEKISDKLKNICVHNSVLEN